MSFVVNHACAVSTAESMIQTSQIGGHTLTAMIHWATHLHTSNNYTGIGGGGGFPWLC